MNKTDEIIYKVFETLELETCDVWKYQVKRCMELFRNEIIDIILQNSIQLDIDEKPICESGKLIRMIRELR